MLRNPNGFATVYSNGGLGNGLGFYTNSDETNARMVINGVSGNVGIGTPAPNSKLEVAGTIHSTSGGIKFPDNTTQTTAASSGTPAGAVMFFNLSSCPSGWTALTGAQGRYLVGLPSGGTLAGTAGTTLSNLENRPVGQHSHGVTDPGHQHLLSGAAGSASYANTDALRNNYGGYTHPATTGITINNSGSVAGTNAPYIQFLVCQKD